MDCALVVRRRRPACRTVPMHRVADRRPRRRGQRAACGCRPSSGPAAPSPFEFMASEVSSEKPKALLVAQVAERHPAAHGGAAARCWPCAGPAVIHTGAGARRRPPGAGRLDRRALRRQRLRHPRHRVERARHVARRLRRRRARPPRAATATTCGSSTRCAGAARSRRRWTTGYITGGVMYECVQRRRAVRARRLGPRRRTAARRVHRRRRRPPTPCATCSRASSVALMLASTLHAIATGNLLPAGRRDLLRRHQPGGRHQARRPRQPPGPRHRHRRRPLRSGLVERLAT